MRIPIKWLSVVHFRFSRVGLHGENEADAFRKHCPLDHSSTREAYANLSLNILPGLIERDFHRVQLGIASIQQIGFKTLEWNSQSPETLAFRDYWQSLQIVEALGLSSFGPTLYCLTQRPEIIVEVVKNSGYTHNHLTVTDVNNIGATFKTEE
jgi:beta-RFAP synthase